MESPKAVSNFFIQKSFETGIPLSPMKVLKLVYLSHGWHMGWYEGSLINEAVQAWKFGPVVASVYHEFKQYGDGNIDKLATQFAPDSDGQLFIKTITPLINDTTPETTTILNLVWDSYKDWDALALSTLTHQANSPWDIVWNQRGGKNEKSAIIPNEVIREYYARRVSEIRAQRRGNI